MAFFGDLQHSLAVRRLPGHLDLLSNQDSPLRGGLFSTLLLDLHSAVQPSCHCNGRRLAVLVTTPLSVLCRDLILREGLISACLGVYRAENWPGHQDTLLKAGAQCVT